jgi:iron-sulfur cluster insertion protein
MTETQEAPPLNFTDAAALKVGQLIAQEGNAALKLRVYVQGGGCSGFQYGFTFDEEIQEGDTEIENGGVTLLVDPLSVQYLMGAEIDYREDLSGAQFVIRNPNASTTCGCGSSFSV